jgi:hypothetical protein
MPHLISDRAYAAIRTLARSVLVDTTTQADIEDLAEEVQRSLRTAEPIDDDATKEFAKLAREDARIVAERMGIVRGQDHATKMVESAESLLMALAMVRMNPDAVERRGEADEE